jgi:hypothetical protein
MATVHSWEYTSDETGACVRALADRVVLHAHGSKVRVDVRRGDGTGLVRMLRDGLPRGVEIDDNASSSSSMSAKLDVSVHVASHVWSLCNVAKVTARLPPGPPLAKYAEWVTANLGTIDARVNAILGGSFIRLDRSRRLSAAEAALRTLLGYHLDTNWATIDEVEATAIRDAVEPLGKAFEILNDTCIEVLGLATTTQEDKELFQTFQLALAAGRDVTLTLVSAVLARFE